MRRSRIARTRTARRPPRPPSNRPANHRPSRSDPDGASVCRESRPAGSGFLPNSLSPPMMREKNPRMPSASRRPIDGPSGLFVSNCQRPAADCQSEALGDPFVGHRVIHEAPVIDLQEARQCFPGLGLQPGFLQGAAHQHRRALPHHRDDLAQRQRRAPRILRASRRSTRPGRALNRSACHRGRKR